MLHPARVNIMTHESKLIDLFSDIYKSEHRQNKKEHQATILLSQVKEIFRKAHMHLFVFLCCYLFLNYTRTASRPCVLRLYCAAITIMSVRDFRHNSDFLPPDSMKPNRTYRHTYGESELTWSFSGCVRSMVK